MSTGRANGKAKAIEKRMSARERRHAQAEGDDSDDDWRSYQDELMPDMTATSGSSSAMGGGSNDNVDEHAASAALDELTRAAKTVTDGAPANETGQL